MIEGFQNPSVQYVTVLSKMMADAQVVPLAIEWDEKTTYRIEKVLDVATVTVEELTTLSGDKPCCMYTVLIGGKKTHLYFEAWTGTGARYPGRWFVLKKN